MRRALVAASKGAFNLIYRMTLKDKRLDEAVFLSRQTNTPSYDFAELAREFERRGWTVHMHLKKVAKRNMAAYAFHVLKEIKLLGRCRVAVIDRYDPVVCLLDFECDGEGAGGNRDDDTLLDSRKAPVNLTFPRKPVVLQLWHAFGAYKKFGHQSVGTLEGHSQDFTSTFNIHRNYSWVVCSGAGARNAFAEAFSCPPSRVVAMDRPEYDELAAKAQELACARNENGQGRSDRQHAVKRTFNVLMAPTLRKSPESQHPFRELYEREGRFAQMVEGAIDKGLAGAGGSAADKGLADACDSVAARSLANASGSTADGSLASVNASAAGDFGADSSDSGESTRPVELALAWSFHPLETGLPAPGNVSDQLLDCDCLVTDYSSIVYEAYLLGIPALFYVSDINDYRLSPGLNVDPIEKCPAICASSEEELADLLAGLALDPSSYPAGELEKFASSAFDIDVDRTGSAASRIVDFVIDASQNK